MQLRNNSPQELRQRTVKIFSCELQVKELKKLIAPLNISMALTWTLDGSMPPKPDKMEEAAMNKLSDIGTLCIKHPSMEPAVNLCYNKGGLRLPRTNMTKSLATAMARASNKDANSLLLHWQRCYVFLLNKKRILIRWSGGMYYNILKVYKAANVATKLFQSFGRWSVRSKELTLLEVDSEMQKLDHGSSFYHNIKYLKTDQGKD
eukprot:Gb_39141 [translate_table: standard]